MSTVAPATPVTTATVKIELPLGQQTLKLSQIDNTVHENNRSSMNEETLNELAKDIANNGMMHNLVVDWKGDGTATAGLIAGFRRYEALLRNALKSLFNAANNPEKYPSLTKPTDYDKGAKAEMPCNFDVGNPKHREMLKSQLPTEYQAALDAAEVAVNVIQVEDEVAATLRNLSENKNRDAISVKDYVGKINKLLAKDVQQKRIADGLGVDKSKVTHLKNIANICNELSEQLLNPKGMSDTELTAHQGLLKIMLEELDRRMAMVKDETELAIGYSTLRMFSEHLKRNREKYETQPLMEVLGYLVRVDKGGNLLATATPDYGVFKERLEAALEESGKIRKKNTTPAAPVEETVTPPLDGNQATPEDLAKAQAATPPTPVAGAGEVAAPAGAGQVANVNSPTGAAAAAGVANEGGVDVASLVGGAGVAAPVQTGEVAAKRETAPVTKYNVAEPASIELWIADCIKIATQPSNSLSERYAQLVAATELYKAIGKDADANWLADRTAKFYAEMQEYEEARDKWMVDIAAQYAGQGCKPFPLGKPELQLK